MYNDRIIPNKILFLAEGFPEIASFGVFDGHFGTIAASVCSQHLHRTVLKRFKKLQEMKVQSQTILTSQQKFDALFCEAVRQVYEEIDENIRLKDNSGCTGISIFIVRNTVDESMRVYCCNVGDSRGVLFTPFIDGTEHPREVGMLTEEDEIRDFFYGTDLDRSEHSRILFAFPLSEDHKLTLPRERRRLEDMSGLPWRPLPSNVVKAQMMLHNALDESVSRGMTNMDSLQEAGYPAQSIQDAASLYIQHHTNPDAKSEKPKQLVYKSLKTADDDYPEHKDGERLIVPGEDYERVSRNSFIARRKLANGEEKGPEALFGMYNFSTNMTRSMGDRYGPRSCLAVPDISAVSLRKDEYARIVIASDGVWDVMKNSEVKDLILSQKLPEDVAIKIVQKAHNEREARRMRMDDITAIVIDLNPENYPKFQFSSLLPSVLSGRNHKLETKQSGSNFNTGANNSAHGSTAAAADSGCACVIN
jgi:serine/threonine protein phosphatase PrpC